MKQGAIKVGNKLDKARRVEVPVRRTETLAECLAECGGVEADAVQFFNRGYDIFRQDAVARPMFDAGARVDEIATALDKLHGKTGYDSQRKGRPAKPKTLEVVSGKKYTVDEMAAMLQKLGVNVVTK